MTEPRFALATRLSVARTELGREGEPLIVIDDLLGAPETLVAAAAQSSFSAAHGPAGGYPGLRAPAPLDYVETVARALLPALVEAFALPPAKLVRAECNFSLVTLPPEALTDAQRAPHVDTSDPWQFALLHYLCDPAFGGTGFYRHRATGFEALTPEREPIYRRARAAEGQAPPGYIDDSDAWFTRIGAIDAAFNRLIVYRSRQFHSGLIADAARLSADPRRGRLTANIFLTLGPLP